MLMLQSRRIYTCPNEGTCTRRNSCADPCVFDEAQGVIRADGSESRTATIESGEHARQRPVGLHARTAGVDPDPGAAGRGVIQRTVCTRPGNLQVILACPVVNPEVAPHCRAVRVTGI